MSGEFTRKLYDDCALNQNTRDSTAPLGYQLYAGKFVGNQTVCPSKLANNNLALVDIESSLFGYDRIASNCNEAQYPLCHKTTGCLLTNDKRTLGNVNPLACSWGRPGTEAVVNTNMKKPTSTGINLPAQDNNPRTNGYYNRSNATNNLSNNQRRVQNIQQIVMNNQSRQNNNRTLNKNDVFNGRLGASNENPDDATFQAIIDAAYNRPTF